MKKLLSIFLTVVLVSIIYSCKKEKPAPQIITLNPENYTSNSVDCGGIILSDDFTDIQSCGICFSQTTNPAVSDEVILNEGTDPTFHITISNLPNHKKYYARAFLNTAQGPVYGNEITFTTGSLANQVYLKDPNNFTWYNKSDKYIKWGPDSSGWSIQGYEEWRWIPEIIKLYFNQPNPPTATKTYTIYASTQNMPDDGVALSYFYRRDFAIYNEPVHYYIPLGGVVEVTVDKALVTFSFENIKCYGPNYNDTIYLTGTFSTDPKL